MPPAHALQASCPEAHLFCPSLLHTVAQQCLAKAHLHHLSCEPGISRSQAASIALLPLIQIEMPRAGAGHVIWNGPKEGVVPFFNSLGFRLPPRKSVADFLQEVTSRVDQQVRACGCWVCVWGGVVCVCGCACSEG